MPEAGSGAGRYAPSPTSQLHVGNLRTAVLADLFAHASGRGLRLRVEDLDTDRVRAAGGVTEQQLADLAALGLRFDGPVVRQSERLTAYATAADRLGGAVYECFCTRREIAEAASAPHADGYRPYPGTCRELTEPERAARRRERPAALRVRADGVRMSVRDLLHGEVSGVVDDFVLRRADGVWAYNLAVVVDDLAMGVDQVVRADDLLSSAPRQAWLAERLGGAAPDYAHVPLVVNARGVRLAKRDGAVGLAELAAEGHDTAEVLAWIGRSLGLAAPGDRVDLALLRDRFDPASTPLDPVVFTGLNPTFPE
ncbi:tRNA glutamyl-Q(34) synthetase GluQRS [Enemella evansiae]|uniref:tRNA glutamyl-Q(34) synthetase GluQRS n=1 Tax=Enemella evansiae TaxID=2016499 RepID=UPI000B96803B|nr:tRNA glutamyl-Q(34) synthetase GluQRS [Enemella evansiae]OYO06594.1 tRNA glutamyl-Q(34) synthetase GluQRS [Enemella evansiae]